MKKSLFTAFIGVSLCALITFNLSLHRSYANDVSLSTIEALAGDGLGGEGSVAACEICGNCTYIPNETLRHQGCPNGGTFLMCVSHAGVCCIASDQTDCTENN